MAEIEENPTGPGKLLRDSRQSLDLVESDIADKLHLSVALIKQLESDQYQADMPDAFIRGYLRTYARVVNLDEDKVIALYSQKIGTSKVRNQYIPSTDTAPVKLQNDSHMIWYKLLSVAVFIVVLVLGWMAYNRSKIIEQTSQVINSDTEKTSIVTNSIRNADNQEQVLTAQQAEPLVNSESITDDSISVTNNNPTPENLSVVEEIQLIEKKLAEGNVVDDKVTDDNALIEDTPEENLQNDNRLTAKPPIVTNLPTGLTNSAVIAGGELTFNFVDDCWVKVTDKNNEVLAVGLKTKGRRFVVNGVPPINVIIGKPRAVKLTYNSQSVDLTPYPASQTARLTLGGNLPSEDL